MYKQKMLQSAQTVAEPNFMDTLPLDAFDFPDALGKKIAVDVAERLYRDIRDFYKALREVHTPASYADDGHIDSVVCADDPSGGAR